MGLDIEKIILTYLSISFVIGLIMIVITPVDYKWESPIDYLIYILEVVCFNRNFFGKILSGILILAMIPVLIFIFLLQVFAFIIKFLAWIWKCGNKKD